MELLDLFTEKSQESEIGCQNCRLSNIKHLKYYFKHKLEDMKFPTVYYKSHFQNPCFNCSSSFHGSRNEDGLFNLQKICEVGRKCVTCQKNYTTERSFYHNCNICNASYNSCGLLVHHRRTEHNSKKPYQCVACCKSLSTAGILKRHIVCKHKLPNKCPYCSERFSTKKILQLHTITHNGDGEKQFSCEYCSKQFQMKQSLLLHLFEHTGGKQFKCNYCDKNFAKEFMLKRHKTVHMGKMFHCKYCPKQFKTVIGLDSHIFEHTGGKAFKCDVCDKTFVNQFRLTQHNSVHMEKIFQCTICNKKFKSNSSLDYHLFEHTGGKPFKCDVCDKTFVNRFVLNRHKSIHMDKSYECTICSKFYKSPREQRWHIKRVHKS